MEKSEMKTEKEANQNQSDRNYGSYLRINRNFMDITAHRLAEGLCGRSMICEIEAGKKSAGRLLRERLLRRSGVARDEYESYLDYEDSCEWKMQEEILDDLETGNIGHMEEALNKYADRYGLEKDLSVSQNKSYLQAGNVTKRLRRQFYLGMLGMCRRLKGAEQEELEVIFETAVWQTVPGIHKSLLAGSVLCAEEINLILEYARCLPEEKSIKQCRELDQYLQGARMEERVKVLNYPKLLFVLGGLLLNREGAGRKECEEVIKLCDRAVELLRKEKRAYYLFELFGIKKAALKRLKGQEPQKENCVDKMLKEMNQWNTAFDHLYRMFGIRREQGSDAYLYREQDVYEVGDMIRARRKMLQITQKEFQEQITCTLETLQNLERKKCSTHPFYVQEMCTKLRLSPVCERTELMAASFKARKLEREIRHAANNGEFEKNLEQMEELKTLIDMSNPINQQWVLRTEGMAKYRLGQISYNEYEEIIRQSLQCTLPLSVLEYPDEKECYLTNSEMECIYHYSLLVSREDPKEAYRRMKVVFRLEKEFEAEGREVNHIRTYELYTGYKARLLYQLGEYEMSKQYIEKIIKMCLQMGRINIIDSLLYTWLCNYESKEMRTEPGGESYYLEKGLQCCLNLNRFCQNGMQEGFLKRIILDLKNKS
ncbi:MAG: hypothetical protein K2N63_16960 [Lachnospiraceae bacterium]|nr:hypothetical protein [Lachnospiraceae bacterium]